MDSDFDFKPLNDGLGFHRKPTNLEEDFDGDDRFALKDLVQSNSSGASHSGSQFEKQQAKSLVDDGGKMVGSRIEQAAVKSATSPTGSAATQKPSGAKHNTKGVSELIAALPPSLDFFSEADRSATSGLGSSMKPGTTAASTASAARTATAAASAGVVGNSSPSVGAMTKGASSSSAGASKKGLIRMPVGREDYKPGAAGASRPNPLFDSVKPPQSATTGQTAPLVAAAGAASAQAAAALDQNLAKAFPHLGRLAGQSASASSLLGLMNPDAQKAPAKATEQAVPVHFGSIVLDALVALGIGCILLAISLGITNANLMALLESSTTDVQTMGLLAVLFVAGGMLYVVGARSFLGATLGEWSYEVRVGEASRRDRWFYPLLVFWRSALVISTGVVLFPILSALFGRDLLGDLTGLKTVSIDSSSQS